MKAAGPGRGREAPWLELAAKKGGKGKKAPAACVLGHWCSAAVELRRNLAHHGGMVGSCRGKDEEEEGAPTAEAGGGGARGRGGAGGKNEEEAQG